MEVGSWREVDREDFFSMCVKKNQSHRDQSKTLHTRTHIRTIRKMYFNSKSMLSMFTAVAFLNKGAFSAPFEGADQEAPSGYVSPLVGDKQEKFPYDWKTAGNARFERRDEPTATFSPNAPTVNNKVYETTVNPPAGRSVPLPGDKRGEPTATFIPGDKRDEPTATFTPEAKFPNDWSTPGNARFLEAAQTLTV